MQRRVMLIAALGVSLSIVLLTLTPPVSVKSEEEASALPSTFHMVGFHFGNDGAVEQILELYFDRKSMQCREDSYLFGETRFPPGNVERMSMEDWEAYKKELLPHKIQIYAGENRYEVYAPDIDRETFMHTFPVDSWEIESYPDPVRVCYIGVYPGEPASNSFLWRLVEPEQLLAHRALMINHKNDSTGEYLFYEDLYGERFDLPPDNRQEGAGGTLTKIWYDRTYMLPKVTLRYNVAPDSSLTLIGLELAEYGSELAGDLFDPELTPYAREELPLQWLELSSK